MTTRSSKSALFWFVKGQKDAIADRPPQHRIRVARTCTYRYYYMMGWHDTKYEISLGIINPRI